MQGAGRTLCKDRAVGPSTRLGLDFTGPYETKRRDRRESQADRLGMTILERTYACRDNRAFGTQYHSNCERYPSCTALLSGDLAINVGRYGTVQMTQRVRGDLERGLVDAKARLSGSVLSGGGRVLDLKVDFWEHDSEIGFRDLGRSLCRIWTLPA